MHKIKTPYGLLRKYSGAYSEKYVKVVVDVILLCRIYNVWIIYVIQCKEFQLPIR